jgi:hypothetical protein
MSLSSNFEFLFVGRDEGNFLENYSYDLGVDHNGKIGKLVISLEVCNNPTDADMVGETLADTIRRVFFANLDSEPYERLEDALKAANDVYRKLSAQSSSNFVGTVNMVVAAVCGDEVFLSQTGSGEAYLVRKKLISVVTDGLNDDLSEGDGPFANIASGKLEESDVLILSTAKLMRYISKSDFVKCVSVDNLTSSLAHLRDKLENEVLAKIALVGCVIYDDSLKVDEAENLPAADNSKSVVHEEVLKTDYRGKAKLANLFQTFKFNADVAWRKTRSALVNSKVIKPSGARDKMLLGIIGVILVLSLGIWYTKVQSDNAQVTLALSQSLDEAMKLTLDAETKGYDKSVANELLRQAETKVVEVRNSGQHRNRANELLEKIANVKNDLDSITLVSEPEKFVVADYTTKRSNFSGLGLLSLKSVIFAFEYNALYELIAGVLQDPSTIDDTEVVIAATEFLDRGNLLFLAKSGRMLSYLDDRFQFIDSVDGVFKRGVAIDDWGNRVYVLDPEANQIWRYTYSGRNDNFAAPDSYVTEADVSAGVDLAIDRYVYVLASDGRILQLLAGKDQNLQIRRPPIDAMQSPTKIFTEAQMAEIFVLEPSKNRVLVFVKDEKDFGVAYSRQFVFENVGQLRDVYFDKDSRFLYVLDESKLYRLEM